MKPKITIIATPTGIQDDVIAHYFKNMKKMKPEDAPLYKNIRKPTST